MFDFPAGPNVGQVFTPSGGPTFIWNGTGWKVAGGATFADAPSDGVLYGRKNALWSAIPALATVVESSYVPVLSPGSGTLTTASAGGEYSKWGKWTFVKINIIITTNGSAAASLAATLPFPAMAGYQVTLAGREYAVVGRMLQGIISSNATSVVILNYDNSYPGGNSYQLALSGLYLAAS